MNFDTCNEIVGKVAREALIGTGLEVMELRGGQVLGIMEVRDSFEFRLRFHQPGLRVLRSVELPAMSCTTERGLAAAINEGILCARRSIADQLRGAATAMEPR